MNNDLERFSEERLMQITQQPDSSTIFMYEVRQLARIALSAKRAKPVAWTSQSNLDAVALEIPNNLEFMSGDKGVYKNPVPLYTTPQPAHTEQVIQDGWKLVPIEPTDEQLRLMLSARYPATFREHLRNPLNGPKSRVEAEKLIVEVTNQYKNALSVAPKPDVNLISEGDKPDGWIKCSERAPEEGGRYWCYVEEQNSLGKSHYQWNCSWNGDCWSDDALSGRVTHWMPLPAAPKPESE